MTITIVMTFELNVYVLPTEVKSILEKVQLSDYCHHYMELTTKNARQIIKIRKKRKSFQSKETMYLRV
jgi:hypothetical protein